MNKITDFESKVYEAVSDIPFGETRSYDWVAREIGHAGAARAVGRALHKNPYTFTVPCHRVVKSDGTLGGYKYGEHLKKRLLIAERECIG